MEPCLISNLMVDQVILFDKRQQDTDNNVFRFTNTVRANIPLLFDITAVQPIYNV